MPKGFFRSNIKNGGKKDAAEGSLEALRDHLLTEEMNTLAKRKAAYEARCAAKKNAPAASSAASAITEMISGSRECSPVGIREDETTSHAPDVESGRSNAGVSGPYYDDIQVCRLLGIRRRVLAKARIKETRGTDWDCVGLRAGMSRDWIVKRLNEGGKPVSGIVSLRPIAPNDGVVSVRLLGVWPNVQMTTVEIVADGSKELATVRDSREMHLGDIFDCRRVGNSLYMASDLNQVAY